jgi:anaerobic selenocysteine-containing dehydrogenase
MDPEKTPVGGVMWPAMTREEAMRFEEVTDPKTGRKVKALIRGTWITYREDWTYPGTKKRFPTPSGKVELYSEILQDFGWDPLPVHREASETPVSTPELAKKYPIILCTGRIVSSFHHWGHWLPWTAELEPHRWINIHPELAKKLGVRDGETVVVENDRGKLEGPAWVTDMVDPRMVWIPESWDREQPFFPYEDVNVLTDDVIKDPIYGQVQYKASLVKVSKLEEK